MDARRHWRDTVAAAQAGDRGALDALVAGWLPLVYSIVGRALNGHEDVDDVVQETMLRAVDGLDGLRDPDNFRSWLVAIAVRQVRDRARERRHASARVPVAWDVDPPHEADTGADFAELTVLRLHLEAQRREVAVAVRWLEDEDRHILSLWWLEVTGELSRREVAAALELTRQHTAVRVQRMKERLETARGIVRALESRPGCRELVALTDEWDGRPGSVWRKRLARHIRSCPECGRRRPGLVPPERLLVGLALVPVPIGVTAAVASLLGGKAAAAAPAAVTAAAAAGSGAGSGGWAAHLLQMAGQPVAAVTAGAVVVAGGAFVVQDQLDSPSGSPRPRTTAAAPLDAAPVAPSPAPPPPAPPSPSARPVAPTSVPPPAALYGTVVDTVDRAPAPGSRPRDLPHRPESGVTSSAGAKAVMVHRGDQVTFTGTGYVLVRWQILPDERPGNLVMPTWTGLDGRLFHVASGGSRRMDDPVPPGSDGGTTGMGSPATGYTVLPPGAQQMWQNEYYYLDGTVTLNQNERGADYNLVAMPSRWDEINRDVAAAPSPDRGVHRYGLVRDTGDDAAPVPQYVTRSRPSDPATVPQSSAVRDE